MAVIAPKQGKIILPIDTQLIEVSLNKTYILGREWARTRVLVEDIFKFFGRIIMEEMAELCTGDLKAQGCEDAANNPLLKKLGSSDLPG